jgi:hypothetical protein
MTAQIRFGRRELVASRRLRGIAACAALALAACTARAPVGPSPAAPSTAAAERATPRSAVEQFYPEVLRTGIPENFVILFVVSAHGRVVRHLMLNTMPGSGGIQVEQVLAPYGLALASLNVIHAKPGEMGPNAVKIAWAELNYDPAETASP